jgi:hypothetical protein
MGREEGKKKGIVWGKRGEEDGKEESKKRHALLLVESGNF